MGRKKDKKDKKRKGSKLTLEQFFIEYFRPLWINGKGLDPKTDRSYAELVQHFVKLSPVQRLKDIDDMAVAEFKTRLGEVKGKRADKLAASSVGKYLQHLKTMLKLAGPRTHDNPQGQGIIKDIPYIVIPKQDREHPGADWTVDEIRSLYDASTAMESPVLDGVTAPEWWRTFVCVAYFTGLRIYALTHVEYSMIHGRSLRVPAKLSKGAKGISQYLHAEAAQHIEAIRRPGRDIILEWPNFDSSRRLLYDQFGFLLEVANIAENRRWKFHSFRKTHLTQIVRASVDHAQGIKIAQHSANHASQDITLGSYIAGGLQESLVAAAIDKMRSPCGKLAAAREAEATNNS